MAQLLGVERDAAAVYFRAFEGLLKSPEDKQGAGELAPFRFEARNRRPPTAPVNAMLSRLCDSGQAFDDRVDKLWAAGTDRMIERTATRVYAGATLCYGTCAMPRFLAVYTMKPDDLARFRALPKAEQKAVDDVGLKQWAD